MSEEAGGSPIKDFLMDKGVDLLLMPVGLFAALWFQNWVDAQKEKEDYSSLISDFAAELQTNLDKVKSLEKDIGPISNTEEPLGPLEEKFVTELDKAKRLALTMQCVDVILFEPLAQEVSAADAGEEAEEETEEAEEPTAEGAENAEAAANPSEGEDAEEVDPLLLPADKGEQTAFCEKFLEQEDVETAPPAVDLSPFYQKVVWQVYTSDGIKLFKDAEAKRLGLSLGELYASQDEVERRVREINDLFNTSMMDASGKMDALSVEVNDLISPLLASKTGIDAAQIQAARADMQSMVKRARELRYAIDGTHTVVSLKSKRLKEYLSTMNGQISSTLKAIQDERTRLGK